MTPDRLKRQPWQALKAQMGFSQIFQLLALKTKIIIQTQLNLSLAAIHFTIRNKSQIFSAFFQRVMLLALQQLLQILSGRQISQKAGVAPTTLKLAKWNANEVHVWVQEKTLLRLILSHLLSKQKAFKISIIGELIFQVERQQVAGVQWVR